MNSKECGDNISDIDGEHFADVDCDCNNDVAKEASLNSIFSEANILWQILNDAHSYCWHVLCCKMEFVT